MSLRRIRSFAAFLALFAALCWPAAAAAQTLAAYGQIEGTVTDESGAVMPGASITVRNTGTGLTREAQTDAKGGYTAPLLPVGSYEVSAALQGFATTRRAQLTVNIGSTTDEVHAEVKRHFSDAEFVELSLTAGFYALVSRMLDAMRVELDEDIRDFSPRLP